MKNATSIGEVQRYLEAALEHLNHAWGGLYRTSGIRRSDFDKARPEVGTTPYHLLAMERYIRRSTEGMYEFVGNIDGQLCPYPDCAHDLAIESAGWCRCGHCGRSFYAEDSDSDIEDYHVRRPRAGELVPTAMLYCRDLGASWATPKEAPAP